MKVNCTPAGTTKVFENVDNCPTMETATPWYKKKNLTGLFFVCAPV